MHVRFSLDVSISRLTSLFFCLGGYGHIVHLPFEKPFLKYHNGSHESS